MFKKMMVKTGRSLQLSVLGVRHQDYFRAALEGNLAMVAAYTRKKGHRPEKLNAVDKWGNTALIMAVFYNRYDVVMHLLGKKANYKHKNKAGQTAEDIARQQGFTELANLLHTQCDITPAQYLKAAEAGNVLAVQTYIEAKQYDAPAMSVTSEYGNTPLMLAIANGQTYAALVMLEKIYDLAIINAANQAGMTALHWAAFHGDIPCLRALLRKGANVRQMNIKGNTAEDEAFNQHFSDVVAILANERHILENQREISEEEYLKAAEKGDLETVNCYLNTRRTNPRAIGISGLYGNTALHLAALYGHTVMVKFLLQALDVFDPITVELIINKTNQTGSTALINAAYNGDMESCKALLQRGGNVDITNKSGINAEAAACFSEAAASFSENFELASILSVKGIVTKEGFIKAAEEGQLEVVKMFIAINYDRADQINTTNVMGDTALISAVRNTHYDVVQALLQIPGIAVNSVNQLGNSALSWAAYHGNPALVAQLIQMGANTVITNLAGLSLIDEVLAKGYIEIANLLAAKQPQLEEKSATVIAPISTISFVQRLNGIGFPYNKIPEDFLDEITQTIMEDPVQFSSGALFDRKTIKEYFDFHHNPAFIQCPKIPGKVISSVELSNRPTQILLRDRIEQFVKNAEEDAALQIATRDFTPVIMHVQPVKSEASYAQLLYALRNDSPVLTTNARVTEVEEKPVWTGRAPVRVANLEERFFADEEFLLDAFADYADEQYSPVAAYQPMPEVEVKSVAPEVTVPAVSSRPATEAPKVTSSSDSGHKLFDHKPSVITQPVDELEVEEQPKPKAKRKEKVAEKAVVCL